LKTVVKSFENLLDAENSRKYFFQSFFVVLFGIKNWNTYLFFLFETSVGMKLKQCFIDPRLVQKTHYPLTR
jgi:hypothetical protein